MDILVIIFRDIEVFDGEPSIQRTYSPQSISTSLNAGSSLLCRIRSLGFWR